MISYTGFKFVSWAQGGAGMFGVVFNLQIKKCPAGCGAKISRSSFSLEILRKAVAHPLSLSACMFGSGVSFPVGIATLSADHCKIGSPVAAHLPSKVTVSSSAPQRSTSAREISTL